MKFSSGILFFALVIQKKEVSAMATTSSTKKKPKILSFGIAAVDFVAVVDHFPEPDEKMRSSSLLIAGGGNAANSACAMGRLKDYVEVDLSTAVGDDANGNTILQGVAEFGVGVDHIERPPNSNSPFSYILTTPDNARTIIHQPSTRNMSVEFCKNSIPLEDYDAVHFDCRHPKAAVALANKCHKKGIPYSVDVERPREGLDELLSKASVVICNSNYCNAVLGTPEKELTDLDVANRLKQVIQKQAPNAKLALQTLGSKGSCLVRMRDSDGDSTTTTTTTTILDAKRQLFKKQKIPVVTQHDGALWCPVWEGCKVVDSTGAGDAFQGGFVAALWSYLKNTGDDDADDATLLLQDVPTPALAHSLRIATRVAAKKLEAPGARDGLPKSSEDGPLQDEFQKLLSLE